MGCQQLNYARTSDIDNQAVSIIFNREIALHFIDN